MRAVVWIEESGWEACVDRARELIPVDAEITLLHVAAGEVEELASRPGPGRLGRHRPPPGPPVRAISEAEAQALLADAQARLRRPAQLVTRRGRIEREVVSAAHGADLLVLARNGEPRPGPPSIGHRQRFVIDHADCDIVLVHRS